MFGESNGMKMRQALWGKPKINCHIGRARTNRFLPLHGLLLVVTSILLSVRSEGQELSTGVMKELHLASVQIRVPNDAVSPGYGIFVDRNIIVTSFQALGLSSSHRDPPSRIDVISRKDDAMKTTWEGTIQELDFGNQIAFVSVKAAQDVKPILMRRSESITQGMPILMVTDEPDANQEENPLRLTSGSVVGIQRNTLGAIEFMEVQVKNDSAIKDGAIIDKSGRLIGLTTTTQAQDRRSVSIPSDVIKTDLEGRIASVIWGPVQNGKSCEVSFEVIDPRRKIRRISAEYWESLSSAVRPMDPQRKFPTYGAAEDGAKKPLKVTFDLNRNQWTGTISEVPVDPQKTLWVQPSFITSRGTILSEAVKQQRPSDHGDGKAMAMGTVPPQTLGQKKVPQKVTVRNEPPRKAIIGKTFEFKPELVESVEGLKVEYKFGRSVQGMTIDMRDGTITFQPSAVHLGIYDIVVIAVVEGQEHFILDWPLEIESAP